MFKMAFQVVFSAKNVPRFSFGLLVAPKPKKQGGVIMAPPWVTTSFQSLGKIGLKEHDSRIKMICLLFIYVQPVDIVANLSVKFDTNDLS